MNNNLPDWPFPPRFFDEAEDEETVNQHEVDKENYWDEQRWRQEEEEINGETWNVSNVELL